MIEILAVGFAVWVVVAALLMTAGFIASRVGGESAGGWVIILFGYGLLMLTWPFVLVACLAGGDES